MSSSLRFYQRILNNYLKHGRPPRELRSFSQNFVKSKDVESDSERWIRLATSESDVGSLSTFEDMDGNPLKPSGKLSLSRPLRTRKRKSITNETVNLILDHAIMKIITFLKSLQHAHFVDFRSVLTRGGNGGDGCIALLHIKNNEFAGPSGGDGGNGGHIVFKADKQVKSLAGVQTIYSAPRGEHGMGDDCQGKSGEHVIIPVPVGTLVKNIDNELVGDLNVENSMFIAARGGGGGKGNHFFLSDKNRHPRVAELGAKGEENKWNIEMRMVAHAGFIGFPSVGKSTLLRAISRARPKVVSIFK